MLPGIDLKKNGIQLHWILNVKADSVCILHFSSWLRNSMKFPLRYLLHICLSFSVLLGVYFCIGNSTWVMEKLDWIPFCTLFIYMFTFSGGLGPVSWVLLGMLATILCFLYVTGYLANYEFMLN